MSSKRRSAESWVRAFSHEGHGVVVHGPYCGLVQPAQSGTPSAPRASRVARCSTPWLAPSAATVMAIRTAAVPWASTQGWSGTAKARCSGGLPSSASATARRQKTCWRLLYLIVDGCHGSEARSAEFLDRLIGDSQRGGLRRTDHADADGRLATTAMAIAASTQRRTQHRRGSVPHTRHQPVHPPGADAIAAEHLSMASASASWANGFASRTRPDAAVPCSSG